MELVPDNVNETKLHEEVNRRTAKAGYTDRDGQQLIRKEIVSMPANDKYRENYVKIFGHD